MGQSKRRGKEEVMGEFKDLVGLCMNHLQTAADEMMALKQQLATAQAEAEAFDGDGPPINANLRHHLYDEIVDLENKGKYKKAQFLRSIIDKYDTQNRK